MTEKDMEEKLIIEEPENLIPTNKNPCIIFTGYCLWGYWQLFSG